MNILILGGTGFVGTTLTNYFVQQEYGITVLARSVNKMLPEHATLLACDTTKPGEWQKIVGDHEVIINLAGISIFRRWTRPAKQAILESRLRSTENLVQSLKNRTTKKNTLLSVSGVGYYGYHGDEYIDETCKEGADFLAQVAAHWELAAAEAKNHGVRAVLCRLGHVLGTNGGVLPKLAMVSKLHAGSQWGAGMQWISWVHQWDICRALEYLIEHEDIAGAINITSPNPVRNREFMVALNTCMRTKPVLPYIPSRLLKIVAGEFSSVFLNGQRVIPNKLLKEGFTFRYSMLADALKDLLRCN